MKSSRIAIALVTTALLAACHGKEQKAQPTSSGPAEKGMPLEVPAGAKDKTSAQIVRMHRVAGRWQSQPGSLKGGRDEWVVLTVSNDNKFTLEVRGPGPDAKVEAVNASLRGPISWTAEGVLTGTAPNPPAPLKGFGSWRGSFPTPGHMTLRGADGTSYDLSYRGL